MNKTKIICTLGPASDKKEVFTQLVKNGLSIARMNLSHGDEAYYDQNFKMIREVEKELDTIIGVLMDTRGPEIRARLFKDGKAELVTGEKVVLYHGDDEGTAKSFCISYPDLYKDVKKGSTILLDDGLMELTVEKVVGEKIHCVIENGGIIKNRKGINVPNVKVGLPALTENDENDIKFGITKDIDYVAASFIRKKADVLAVRKLLDENGGKDIKIISKIENQEGVDNIQEILEVTDGVMVARGDLGVEIPGELIPKTQKMIIEECNKRHIPVITATQMLDSMINNPRPTRAELSDVYNAVLDGTDAIMLSGETAAGDYPAEAVKTMRKIADSAETSIDYKHTFKRINKISSQSITNAVGYSSCSTAMTLDAAAIICPTFSGKTARYISKFRPSTKIVATTTSLKACRQMKLLWGVEPMMLTTETSTDILYYKSIEKAKKAGYVKDGDLVVITAGVPLGQPGSTNSMRVMQVN